MKQWNVGSQSVLSTWKLQSHPISWQLHFSTWLSRQLGVSTHEPPFPQLTSPLKSLMYIKDCWFHRVFPHKGTRINREEASFPNPYTELSCVLICNHHETAAVSVEVDASPPPWLSTWSITTDTHYTSNNRKVFPYSVPHLMTPKVTDFKGAGPYKCTCVITNCRMGTSKLLLNQISSRKTQPWL